MFPKNHPGHSTMTYIIYIALTYGFGDTPFWEPPDIPIEQPSNLVRCGYHDILKIQWDMTLFYKQLT